MRSGNYRLQLITDVNEENQLHELTRHTARFQAELKELMPLASERCPGGDQNPCATKDASALKRNTSGFFFLVIC